VLQERSDYAAVISPLGIPVSPIIAPARDLYGQLRSDDPSQASAPGLGAAVFKDRGAIDRVDFTQPWMTLATPLDQSLAAPVDRDPLANRVRLEREEAASVTRFVLQLNDVGVGLDKSTVVKEAFQVVRDGTLTLVEGADYLFRFLESSNQIVLESASVFPLGEYVITATSRPTAGATTGLLTDLANNPLLPNLVDGSTRFVIALVDVPGAPLALTGVPGDQQVALSWQAPVTGGGGITDYVIDYSLDGGTNWTRYADAVSPSTTVVVTGLTNGTTYVFRVAAVNAVGQGSFSAVSTPLTPSAPAGPPTGVAGVPGNAQVGLTWTAPTDTGGTAIVDYVVQYRVNVVGSQWVTFTDGTSAATTATVTGLANGTAYVFRVAAVNAAVAGPYSVASAPVTPRTLPTAPRNLTRTVGDTQVSLTWTAPSSNGGLPITDYVVQFSSTNGTSWTTFTDGVSTGTTATVTGLTNGTTYIFRVAAITGAGTGPYAVSAPATPLALAAAPTALAGTAGDRQVALTWTAPSNTGGLPITDYVVQFSNTNGTSWTTFTDGVSAATGATVTNLLNGTAYRFRVAAVTLAGTGAFTAASAAIIPVTTPAAPTNVGGFGGNGLVNLSWTAPASNGGRPIKDYQISFSTDGTNYTVFADGVSAATSATVTGLTNGTTYFFRVRAINQADRIGGFGQSAGIRPFVAAPAPTGLTAVGGDRSVALTWTRPTTTQVITDYVIQFRTDVAGSAWQTFADGTSTTTQAVVTGLTTGTRYFFRVAAVTTTGPGTFTDGTVFASPVSVPVAGPTSVRGLGRSGTITLLWNAPASSATAPVTRYVIQYRINSAGSAWQTLTISPTTTSAAITGLTNRLGYFFRVAAANGAGIGPWSTESGLIRPY
jgi:hypothetical protein